MKCLVWLSESDPTQLSRDLLYQDLIVEMTVFSGEVEEFQYVFVKARFRTILNLMWDMDNSTGTFLPVMR